MEALFALCDERKVRSLDKAGIQKLNAEMFKMFKRIGQQQETGIFWLYCDCELHSPLQTALVNYSKWRLLCAKMHVK